MQTFSQLLAVWVLTPVILSASICSSKSAEINATATPSAIQDLAIAPGNPIGLAGATSLDELKFISSLISPSSTSRFYNYVDNSSLHLGQGFDPTNVFDFKEQCFNANQVPYDSGPPHTYSSLGAVKSSEAVARELSVDISATAQAPIGKASAQFKSYYQNVSKDNTISVGFSATTIFGRWGLGEIKLNDRGAEVKDNPIKFRQRCGYEYVALETRASTILAIITISDVSQDTVSRFYSETRASAGSDFLKMSATAQAIFSSELKRSTRASRINTDVYATGGPGHASLAGQVKAIAYDETKDALREIGQALADFSSKFDNTNAATILYVTQTVDQFSPERPLNWTREHNEKMRNVVIAYMQASSIDDQLNQILDGKDPRSRVLSDVQKRIMQYKRPQLTRYLDTLERVHDECQKNGSEDITKCNYIPASDLDEYLPFPLTSPRLSIVVQELREFLQPRIKFTRARLSDQEARLILNSPQYDRDRLVKGFGLPEGGVATFQVTGWYVSAIQLVFQDSTGKISELSHVQPWSSWPEDVKPGPMRSSTGIWWAPKDYKFLPNDVVADQEEEKIKKAFTGEWRGKVYVRIYDQMGRSFEQPIMSLHINSASNVFEYELDP